MTADHTTHPSNFRAEAEKIVTDEWWFGFEQEYVLRWYNHKETRPLGFENFNEPEKQGKYYCSVGHPYSAGREISEQHMDACLSCGINVTGTNAEVMLGQWEYQIFSKGEKNAADDLWMSRFLLLRIAEAYKVKVDFQKFPVIGLKPKAFSATVVPYASGTTSMRDIAMYEWVNPLGVATVSGTAGDPKCIWTENGTCGVEVAFPKDAKVKLTIHLGNYLTSWLHGRLTEPTVDISAITKTQNRLVVEAAPVMTPSATALVPSTQVSPNIANNFRDPSGYLPPGEISMMTTASSDGALKNFLDKSYSNN